jgi:succinate dehydrogenase / fumarate reductase cytochrome b subunit
MSKQTMDLKSKRPTSPHLGIYKWQMSNSLSILHRLTGVGMYFSLNLICWWGILVVFGNFNPFVISFSEHILFKAAILLSIFALLFHLATGIRHLFWDAGYGFSIRAMNFTGCLAIFCALSLTGLVYFYVLS